MPNLEDQILKLTNLWLDIIGLDHHKDKDCRWFIEEQWAYGDKPKWYAHHNGYIYKDWLGPDRDSREEALKDLYNELIKALKQRYKWAFNKDFPEEYNEYPSPETRKTYKRFKEIINARIT